jgi:hypothetical protein
LAGARSNAAAGSRSPSNNCPFLLLPHKIFPNLGSRALRLTLDRLSAGWQELGTTDGFGRVRLDLYVQHKKAKRHFARELAPRAACRRINSSPRRRIFFPQQATATLAGKREFNKGRPEVRILRSCAATCASTRRKPSHLVKSLPPAEWNSAQWPEFNRAASGSSAASATACSCTGAAGKRNPGTKPPPTSTPP